MAGRWSWRSKIPCWQSKLALAASAESHCIRVKSRPCHTQTIDSGCFVNTRQTSNSRDLNGARERACKRVSARSRLRKQNTRADLDLTRSPCYRTEDPRWLLEDTLDVFGVVAAPKWPAQAFSGWDSFPRPVVGPLRRWDVSANLKSADTRCVTLATILCFIRGVNLT